LDVAVVAVVVVVGARPAVVGGVVAAVTGAEVGADDGRLLVVDGGWGDGAGADWIGERDVVAGTVGEVEPCCVGGAPPWTEAVDDDVAVVRLGEPVLAWLELPPHAAKTMVRATVTPRTRMKAITKGGARRIARRLCGGPGTATLGLSASMCVRTAST
jgi:hypothetical protein